MRTRTKLRKAYARLRGKQRPKNADVKQHLEEQRTVRRTLARRQNGIH